MANIMKRNRLETPMTFGGLVDRVFENSVSRFLDDDSWGFNGMLTSNQMPVNVKETDKTFDVEMVAPGLNKEDFNVQVNGNMLTISYEHKEEQKEEDKDTGYVRQEYRTQSFTRNFTLDDTVDANNVSANYRDGILHLSLNKKEGARRITKKVEVK
jgi:HSP20 family protein